MKFSERMGHKKIKNTIQINSMDDDLRIGLWNAVDIHYWQTVKFTQDTYPPRVTYQNDVLARAFFNTLWPDYFKRPIDTLPYEWAAIYKEVREYFFSRNWVEVYDFIEFIAHNYPSTAEDKERFRQYCNQILERELSAYRFVGSNIAPITNTQEIKEIESALIATPKSVQEHIGRSLELFSDRSNPDYKNSIKEAISAVESLLSCIAQMKKANFDKALEQVGTEIQMHPALNKAFQVIYSYTSGPDGIRHAALRDDYMPEHEEAQFMLILCSSFVNYLVAKAAKRGITF